MVFTNQSKPYLLHSNLKFMHMCMHYISVSSTSLIANVQASCEKHNREKTSQFGKIGHVFMPPVFVSHLGGGV